MNYFKKILIIGAVSFVALTSCAFYGWLTPDVPPQIVEKIVEKQVPPTDFSLYEMANAEREDKMVWNPCLHDKAEDRARQIVDTDFFSHTDINGDKPYMKLIDECFRYVYSGENLIKDASNYPDIAHSAFMNSPTHKANIVNPNYHQMGVGCYENVCVEFFSD